MQFSQQEEQAAQLAQKEAAEETAPKVRLVAGPGTGKTKTIKQRVGWLLNQSVNPRKIAVVSFTRASAYELKERVIEYANSNGISGADEVPVSTLHSLALKLLRRAGMLTQYPSDPLVLDNWEQKEICYKEMAIHINRSAARCRDICFFHEAFWSTGIPNSPNYAPPEEEITQQEINSFNSFYPNFTQTYSCMLPGEIIRACVTHIGTGALELQTHANFEHLLIDEFQDLNPIDQELVEAFINLGVKTFIAGDDDQSIYSFRYAEPSGIQNFLIKYTDAKGHKLEHCFRCPKKIIEASEDLLNNFPLPNRIQKSLTSMLENSSPKIEGKVYRFIFPDASNEAYNLAKSCKNLIEAGVLPEDIFILLSSPYLQANIICEALEQEGVSYSGIKKDEFIDLNPGRFLFGCLRIVCKNEDYIAHRTILGLLNGVGPAVLKEVFEKIQTNTLNFKDLFYQPLLQNTFSARSTRAIERTAEVIEKLQGLTAETSLTECQVIFDELLEEHYGEGNKDEFQEITETLPEEINIGELRNILSIRTEEEKKRALGEIYLRLEMDEPEELTNLNHVRILSMHGAKGLSSKIVFVPGLEEGILPSTKSLPFNAKILESARLLFVSLTRAGVACILSFARRRMIYGRYENSTSSRFISHLGGTFSNRNAPLSPTEAEGCKAEIDKL